MNLAEAAINGHLDVVRSLVENGADIHADNDFALRYTAVNGHIDIVRFLVENGADIHANNDLALRWAAEYGHLDVVRYLVENGADTLYLLDIKGNPTKIAGQTLTKDQIEQAKQLFIVRKILTD
jgi:ankyrin repeat protein